MNLATAKRFVRYWNAAKMVSFSEIKTEQDASIAIKFCECLRTGVAHSLTPATLFAAITQEFPRT